MLSRWTAAGRRLSRFDHVATQHLIRLSLTRTNNFFPALSSTRQYSAMDSVSKSLTSLALTSTSVSHSSTNSPAAWRDALVATPSVPASFELIKTLIFKPKTAKTATPVPVVVIARESASVNSTAIGKKLNLKDLRLASEDLLKEFFALDKDSRTIFLSFMNWMLTDHCSISSRSQRVHFFKSSHRRRCLHR
jgi:hypothetical protein